jgi:YD repeat-containing protein
MLRTGLKLSFVQLVFRLTIIEISGKGSKIKFHYNSGGKMVGREFIIPGIPPIKVEYKYDNAGRRTSVKDIGGETIYEWDSDGRLKAVSSGKKKNGNRV